MRYVLPVLVGGLCILGWNTSARADDLTINNRTEYDIFVAVGKYSEYCEIDGPNFSTQVLSQSWMKVNGWWKVNRFGGSVTVPAGSHIMVTGKPGKQTIFPKGSVAFPYIDAKLDFYKHFGSDDKFRTNGALAQAAKDKGMKLQLFAPVQHFKEAGELEITLEKLGWSAPANSGNNNPGNASNKPVPNGGTTVFVPTQTIKVTFTNSAGKNATFVLKGGVGPGMATGLANGSTKTFSLSVAVGTTPTVTITQPGGGSLSFSIESGGNYELKMVNGEIQNFYK